MRWERVEFLTRPPQPHLAGLDSSFTRAKRTAAAAADRLAGDAAKGPTCFPSSHFRLWSRLWEQGTAAAPRYEAVW